MALLRHREVREGWPLSNWEQASVPSASGTAYEVMASVRFIERMVECRLVGGNSAVAVMVDEGDASPARRTYRGYDRTTRMDPMQTINAEGSHWSAERMKLAGKAGQQSVALDAKLAAVAADHCTLLHAGTTGNERRRSARISAMITKSD